LLSVVFVERRVAEEYAEFKELVDGALEGVLREKTEPKGFEVGF
jgi:hypothetical protein